GVVGDVQVVARAGGEGFQSGAVGAAPDDAATAQLGLAAVLADHGVDALVAGGHVDEAVHRQADVRRDVVVKSAGGPGIGVGAVEQVGAVFGDAGAVVGEDGELRGVVDVELAVEVEHAEDGVELFGEDGDVAVGVK